MAELNEVETLEALVLGVLQGVGEFLPISSSGHLALSSHFLGVDEGSLALSIVLHFGTLIGTLLVFRADVRMLFAAAFTALRKPSTLRSEPSGRLVAAIIVGSVPTALIGLMLKDSMDTLDSTLWVIGTCFVITSALLFVTRRLSRRDESDLRDELSLRGAFLLGVAQGIAVFPGISRSGITIVAAMALGLSGAAAFRMSFLFSLPAVAGAVLLLLVDGGMSAVPSAVWLGGAVALLVGIASLLLLRKVVIGGRLWTFALYLLPLGLSVLAYDLHERGVFR